VGIARRWVFPVIRIILIAVIAVALGKLAFFPDKPAEADPAVPTGAVIEPTVPVTLGSITNDVVIDARRAPSTRCSTPWGRRWPPATWCST
jgi:macrolide-specific efflux system membrane fusion protein